MGSWFRRLRGALGMGLVWALAGIVVAGGIELIDNLFPAAHPFTRLVDMWPMLLAMVGFVGGTIFGGVLSIAARNRRFEELSLPRFAGLGALVGLIPGAVIVGPGILAAGGGLAAGALAFLGVTTAVGTVAATGSLLIARTVEDDRPET